MNLRSVKLTYYIAFCLVFVFVSCRQTKNVPPGKHLLKKNRIEVKGDKLDEEMISGIIRQQPNRKTLGLRMRLAVYNTDNYFFCFGCDSTRLANKRVKQLEKLRKKNKKRIARGEKINEKRRKKADQNGTVYVEKYIALKDTIAPRAFFREIFRADTLTIARKRLREDRKISLKNQRKKRRQERINIKRIAKAKEKGDSLFYEKIIPLKDTIDPRKFFREWMKYKIGERPVVFDTALYNKSLDQIQIYIKKKGYYYGNVYGDLDTNKRDTKISAKYIIETGKAYYIDSVIVKGENTSVLDTYNAFVKEQGYEPLKGQRLDSDMLNEYKAKVAKYMRNETLFGFMPAHVTMLADTVGGKTIVTIKFIDRTIKEGEREYQVKHQTTYVRDVYFHVADTMYFKGNFKKTMESMGLKPVGNDNFLYTLDSLEYNRILMSKKEKRNANPPIDVNKDTLQRLRSATFFFNSKPAVKPGIIELQNYLEETNYYKEYYLERSHTRLLQLGVFQTIKPVLEEIPGTNKIDVHYYLVPADKQGYSFEPRFTNSNGFLGVAASVNYHNKNLLRGSERLTISLSGGFESTPPIFDQTLDGTKIKNAGRSFNTFEIGPTVKLDLPGLFPIPVTTLAKRKMPRTILSTAYNYQKRVDFDRGVFQFNYTYKFVLNKTQMMQFGFPFASVIKFVAINKNKAFEDKLVQTNDLFLRNAYSDQFIWQDFRITFEYNNKNADNKKKLNFFYNVIFDHAGLFTSWVSKDMDTATKQRQIFGVAYSQFARLDNEFIISYPLKKGKSLNFHLVAGGGLPYGNTTTSLPYDYSFFAGGANDNRGWRARALGPGSYEYYLDPDRTATQIGDLRLGGSGEFRFSMSKLFKGAVFMDAGNIWTTKDDPKRPGGKITPDWYKEIALSAGLGLRLDFNFFVVRFDLGIPLTNPALPEGSRWIFQSRQAYHDKAFAKFGENYETIVPKPFIPAFHFGIGYPF